MSSLIAAGKIRYWGLSNSPAWYVAQLATLARAHGLSAPMGLQYFYSLVERGVEDEHVPLARAFDMGLVPWSPLAYGLLTGKYDRAAVEAAPSRAGGVPNAGGVEGARPEGDKRLDGDNPFGDMLFTERNWTIVHEVKRVAAEIGETPARVALAWVVSRPGVASTLMGVSRAEQVAANVAALDLILPPEHLSALDAVSGEGGKFLYGLFKPPVRNQIVFGGAEVQATARADV
jgi:aryl-alcohol dehydrogenase-like predicted oxidoreductase